MRYRNIGRARTGMLVCAAVMGLGASRAPAAISIPTVLVGNPGNAADPMTGLGSVAYAYSIGKYEVTAGQYAEFLNAVAATDTHGLYNVGMINGSVGCGITRTGASGNYSYSVDPAFVNRPVGFVTFWSACRFANWMHNGQPTGAQSNSTTEDGAYTLTSSGIDANSVSRNAGWQWALPSASEWYKAAYYMGGSTNAGYWLYPTGSNTAPGRDLADPSGNNANFYNYDGAVYPIQPPYYTTTVGMFQNSPSPHGTFDQGGNVAEWNETISDDVYRGIIGGSLAQFDLSMRAGLSNGVTDPIGSTGAVGFRIVRLAGDPSNPCTLADSDVSGTVTVSDLFIFLALWFAQNGQSGPSLSADIDSSGSVSVNDLFAYLAIWFEYNGAAC